MAKIEEIGNARHISDEINALCEDKLPIAVDFDGTIVYHNYPTIGRLNEGCVEVLKNWSDNGVGIILDTMRGGKYLEDAVKFCKDNGIELYAVGKEPHQHEWTDTGKCYALFSIDDRNLGVPLKKVGNERPCVDWFEIDRRYTYLILNYAKRYKKN